MNVNALIDTLTELKKNKSLLGDEEVVVNKVNGTEIMAFINLSDTNKSSELCWISLGDTASFTANFIREETIASVIIRHNKKEL